MRSLKDHMELISSFVAGQSAPETLAPLMEPEFDLGPRAMVYRNSSLSAATEALRSNYPGTAAIMGADFFGSMARSYIDANRPKARSLVGYGQTLVQFISAAQSEHRLAWLSDVAALDRAWLEAHLASDQSVMLPGDFAELADRVDNVEKVRLSFVPSVRLRVVSWSVFDLWRELRKGQVPTQKLDVLQSPEQVLLWRSEHEVQVRRLSAAEYTFLQALLEQGALGVAAASALAVDGNLSLQNLLAATVAAGLYVHPNSKRGNQ